MAAPSLYPRAEAHGKVILLGEHAVVHGYPALAAGLQRGLVLTATHGPSPSSPGRLEIPAWALDLACTATSEHPVVRACLEVLSHCDGPLHGWHIRGETRLPARAGLGSSAALSVAFARLVLGSGDAASPAVLEGSLAGERVFHGDPSGLDSHVAAHGGLLRFSRQEEPRPLHMAAPLWIVVIPTGAPRSTAAQVSLVRRHLAEDPHVAQPALDLLGETASEGIAALENLDLTRLGALMDVAQTQLATLGVSTPQIDRLCALAREQGALGAKLTGAGGGGSLIALPAPDAAHRLATYFVDLGLEAFAAEIGTNPQPGLS